jgi:signal transduction histidine kinase
VAIASRRPMRHTADTDVRVFSLRSIRRKLALSLALVMCMLLLQGLGGLSGLLSYRHVIHDLDRTQSAPRRTEIVAALAEVFGPLSWSFDKQDGLSYRQQKVRERLMFALVTIEDYHRRLEAETVASDVRIPTEAVLHRMGAELSALAAHEVPRLVDPQQNDDATRQLRRGVASLQLAALSIPLSDRGVEVLIEPARTAYRSRFWLISVSSAAAVVLFLSLIRCTYTWIFVPIRKLHQGASRVAQGDFSYRVQLPGNDEMAQLAEKFNLMTARFEEIKGKLDREVCERSKQLLRSGRLAGVGFLAAGVAHEINNPLSAIAMAAESLEGRLQSADDLPQGLSHDDLEIVRQYLTMIQREAFRCQQITQRLLDFSRGQDAPRSPHDLTKIIGEVLDMVGHMSKFRGHEMLFDRSRPVWLTVNGSEIKQVALNLVANALESMEGTGRLKIEIAEHADEVVLTFQDSGCGMTPRVLENLFEPFFTEKKSGRGTGLGLSISHRIVSDHGGRIEAASDGPGQGSTFRVHLPRRPAAAQAA